MSAFVKLATALPGDPETNGVDALADVLVANPRTVRVAVLWFDVGKITTDTDTGDEIPTIRVRRLEPIGNVGNVDDAIVRVVAAAVEERTGRTAIPFGIVDVETADPDQLALVEP